MATNTEHRATSTEHLTTDKPFDYKKFNEYKKTPKYWGRFDSGNPKHRYILSLLHQLGWTTLCPVTGRSYADLERLGTWLQSERAPVQKPLMKMDKPKPTDPSELSITITALEGILKSKFK